MREFCRVRVTAEEARALRALLGLTYCASLPEAEALAGLSERAWKEIVMAEQPQELLLRASGMYGDSDCDVEIDEDAALSETAEGTWVGAWVWVPNDPEELPG